jgi:HEAT repeat protein
MTREKGRQNIRDVLKCKDKYLWDKLEKVWSQCIDTNLTNLALNHALSVENNVSSLIPDEWKFEKLSSLELFALSAASCLHDIDKCWGIGKRFHGEISSGEIRVHFSKYGLDACQADVVGWIIKVHDHGDFDFDLPQDPIAIGSADINIQPLAALFRLADILHADYYRVDKDIPVEPKDRARYCIRGWKYDDNGRIVFCANPEQISDLEHIHRAIAMIRKDIERIAPILQKSGYPYEVGITEIDESKLIYSIKTDKLTNRPFLGMDSFNEDDEHNFKGRENESKQLYQMLLMNEPIIALVGEAGIGKTSLIKAGLLPIIRKSGWKFAYLTMNHDDIFDNIQKLWFQMLDDSIPKNISFTQVLKIISDSNHHINNLILLDQFENILDSVDVTRRIKETLYHVQSKRFHNIQVLLCYRSDFEDQISPMLNDIAYSMKTIPKYYLNSMDIDGSREALLSGMGLANVGFDPNIGAKDFVDKILKDIEKNGKGFYPPYIQMVGETLSKKALKEENSIIQKTLYDSLGGVDGIIGKYLYDQLEFFNERRKDIEDILIELIGISSSAQPQANIKSVEDLSLKLGISDLKILLRQMSYKWIIRHLGSGRYELMNKHITKQIIDRLILSRKEIEFKKLRENLCSIASIYSNTGILLDPVMMVRLYSDRELVKPDFKEKIILLHSCIALRGPAWFWFRDSDSNEYISVLCSGLSNSSISLNVIKLLGYTRDERMLVKLTEFLNSPNEISCLAVEALGRLGSKKAIPILINKLDNSDKTVRIAVIKALSRLNATEAIPKLMEIIKFNDSETYRIALSAYSKLASQEDIPNLKKFLGSFLIYEKLEAINAMSRILGVEFIPIAKEILKDRNRYIRIAGINALSEIVQNQQKSLFSDESLSYVLDIKSNLYSMLQDRSKDVRIKAFKSFAKLSSYNDLSILRQMLNLDILDIKIASAEALSMMNDQVGLNILREIFRNYGKKGQIALDALIRLGDKEIIPELFEMLRSGDIISQKIAFRGLSSLGTEEEIALLLDMINTNPNISIQAQKILIYIDRKLYCPIKCDENDIEK